MTESLYLALLVSFAAGFLAGLVAMCLAMLMHASTIQKQPEVQIQEARYLE